MSSITSSILSYIGRTDPHACGYCKSSGKCNQYVQACNGNDCRKDSSISFGIAAHLINVDLFNRLLDMGWTRRCLGLWANRINIDDYTSLIDRGWRRSGKYLYKPIMEETCCPQYTIRLDVHKFQLSRTQKRVLRTMLNFLKNDVRPSERASAADKRMTQKKTGTVKKELSASITLPDRSDCCRKKKLARRLRAEERLRQKSVDVDEYKHQRMERERQRQRTLESYFSESSGLDWKHTLKVRLVNILSEEFAQTFREAHALFRKYQMSIHSDSDVSEASYRRFLASSPFISYPTDDNSNNVEKEPIFGAFHEQFILDGKIIAVGVIDVLPRCISSKYFFYDPDYKFLSMGTYSALREILLTRTMAQRKPELHFYYMGFYIYTCPKMRYKGSFRPSDLLCDKTFEWFSLLECEKELAANGGRFTTFSDGKPSDKLLLSSEELAREEARSNRIVCTLDGKHAATFSELSKEFDLPQSMRENLKLLAHYAGPVSEKIILLYSLDD